MKKLRLKNNNKNTIYKKLTIVFFCALIIAVLIFNAYGKNITPKVTILIEEKLDKVFYRFFTDLITDDVINKDTINDLLVVSKNNKDEILLVSYDVEKSYKILTDLSVVLKKAIDDLENGKIDVTLYDKYLSNSKNGLILNVPLFLNSENIFLNSIGPMIPVKISFNENLLTNIKTKVTNYGFNNALLEIYITVEMQKLIITPVNKYDDTFNYDILIAALVVNGSVPKFYGNSYESSSKIFDIPLN